MEIKKIFFPKALYKHDIEENMHVQLLLLYRFIEILVSRRERSVHKKEIGHNLSNEYHR